MASVLKNPHFAMPMRMGQVGVAVVEQDSYDEIYNGAMTVIRYEIGQRKAVPDFGIPDQALRQNGADLQRIVTAIAEWEPDAIAVLSHEGIVGMVDTVLTEIGAKNTNGR